MRIVIVVATALFLQSAPLLAQQEEHPKAWGHGFAGFGAFVDGNSPALYHFGGGGGGLLAAGVGVNIDLGVVGLVEGGDVVGLFSPGALYAFNRREKLSPFVTGGYSMLFRSGALHGGFIGGGVNYWLGDSLGLRFEVRDHIFSEGDTAHLLEGRFSVVFH